MKVTCNSILEAPLINMIKLYDSLNVKGVCGILTLNSKHNVEHTTISAISLLSYCNELEVVGDMHSSLMTVDITVSKGGITYDSIASSSGGLLTTPQHLSKEPFAMCTEDVSFKLVIGETTAKHPLLEDDVYAYVTSTTSQQHQFTGVPLPLLSKNLMKFQTKTDNGVSIITVSGGNTTMLDDLFQSIKIERLSD